MCGILGTAAPAAEASTELVAAGLVGLRHRGPEAARCAAFRTGDRACVLGHTRLRIIDLTEHADQPIANEDGTVQVVFNGELYEFLELRAELEAAGHRFASTTDTEVLVHLYEHVDGDPERLLARLRGMFAFALWDARRGRLLLARDRLGIKPMYHAEVPGGGVAFASEALALARSGLIVAGPDTVSLVGYLLWGSVQGPRTALAGVRELPPGSYLSWDDRGAEVVPWWRPVFHPTFETVEAASLLRDALGDAIERHLVADREVGLFLSGGVDSGSIANVAVEAGILRSLTVTFPEVGDDESAAAARIASRLGLKHEEVPVSGADVAAALTDIAAAMDQPTGDGVNSWLVSRAAHQAGLVVALSGVGGDELFGGYPSFRLVPRVAAITDALRLGPIALRRRVAGAVASRRPGSPGSRVLMASPGFGGAYLAVRCLFGARDLARLGALRWIGEHDTARLFTPDPPPTTDPGDAVALLEIDRYLRNQLLRDTDVMSMAHSLEVRVPLLDDRVVAAALATPSSIRNRPGKALLQEAVGLRQVGPKRGFTLPFDQWMRGPLREPMRELVLSRDLPLPWLMTPRGRRDLWAAFEGGRVHWSRPWAVGMLRLWAEQHDLRW
jgi:asparagine synthase (glutamine-hydrolysing)